MKLKNLFRRIPRPVKAIFCALCAIILAIAYYIALDCPTLFFRQEFRRAEKANLVGPSKIVDTMDDEYHREFDKMIVGETEYGICFFGRYGSSYSAGEHSGEWNYLFTYLEKTGDLTIAAAPNVWGPHWGFGVLEPSASIPVYVFTESSDAVKADITIRVLFVEEEDIAEGKAPYEEVFQAEAQRDENGFFRLWLFAETKNAVDALFTVSNIGGGNALGYPPDSNHEVIATVRLYDQNGNLTLEKEVTLKEASLS